MQAQQSKATLLSSIPALVFYPGLSLDAGSFAVTFISLKIVLTESFSYITIVAQMAGNIIQKRFSSKIFSCKFCEVF